MIRMEVKRSCWSFINIEKPESKSIVSSDQMIKKNLCVSNGLERNNFFNLHCI